MYKLLTRSALAIAFSAILWGSAVSAENASNPLAAVNNTDLRFQGTSSDARDKYDFYVDGAYMVMSKLKLKYELHYISTDITGSNENGFEKLVLKPIYFPSQGDLDGGWGYRTAVGFDAIIDLGEQLEGTSIGSNQFAPLVGVAFSNKESGLTLIPLLQHFIGVGGGTDISQTSGRLIAIKPFGEGNWVKMDAKIPYDWEANTWPATAEIQVGRNLSKKIALYGDVLIGVGADRPYDYGLGVGLRFNY